MIGISNRKGGTESPMPFAWRPKPCREAVPIWGRATAACEGGLQAHGLLRPWPVILPAVVCRLLTKGQATWIEVPSTTRANAENATKLCFTTKPLNSDIDSCRLSKKNLEGRSFWGDTKAQS